MEDLPQMEDLSQSQSSLSESEKSPEKPGPMNRHENFREKEKNEKTRSLSQTSPNSVFKTFDLSPEEVELFHGRRYEPRKTTLAISGLNIDRKTFTIKTKEELPVSLVVPLPGGEGQREFTRTFVDFQSRDSFVWVGTAKNNTLDSFHLSFYRGVMVGSVETSKGSYEIKQLRGNKNIIRKIDRSLFPENENDAVFKPSENEQSLKPSLEEGFLQQKGLSPGGQSPKPPLEDEISQKSRPSPEVQSFQAEDVFSQSDVRKSVQIDIVLGFSHLIKNSEGSLEAAKALMNQFVSAANTIHRNSGTGVVINVRAMMELNVSSLTTLRTNLYLMSDAYSVETGGDGFDRNDPYHLLAYKRYETGSDLTALVTEKRTGTLCGTAYYPTRGNQTALPSVTAADCRDYTFAHEISHGLGAMHARDQYSKWHIDSNAEEGIYPYAYGIRFPGHVRTVMSYDCKKSSCQRIRYFSGPNHSYTLEDQTFVLGVADEMDNSRAIRERSLPTARISALRPSLLEGPRITNQPVGGNLSSGSLTLEVVAEDPNTPKRPLSYQWYKDDQVLSGEETNRLVIQSSSDSESHNYYVIVLNDVGQVQSTEVRVSAFGSPRITGQPVGGELSSGSLTLEVVAEDSNTPKRSLSYQWYKGGQALSGEETNRLVVQHSPSAIGNYNYYVIVSNDVGQVQSTEVTVSLLGIPRITTQPIGGELSSGSLTLEVVAEDPNTPKRPLSYQWYKNGQVFSGEETNRLVVQHSPSAIGNHNYYVIVSNDVGQVQSTEVTVSVLGSPRITTQPVGGVLSSGSLTLEVIAEDPNTPKRSLLYQWYKNGQALSGEETNRLIVQHSPSAIGSYNYYVIVSNDVGQIKSTEVTVSLLGSPRITTQPVGGVLSSGSLTLEVIAEDPNTPKRSLFYQWYKNGQALSGEETNRLIVQHSSSLGESHNYYVIVSNDVGQTRSTEVTVSIPGTPQIISQPVEGVFSSGSLTLEVVAVDPNTPKQPLSYQWYKDDQILSGETGTRLVLQESSSQGTVNSYYVKVTNSVGSIYSSRVVIDLRSPPRITTQPVGGVPPSSGSLTLEVVAEDPNTPKQPLSYQWYRDDRILSGEKTNRLVIQSSSASESHNYYVTVSNDVGQTRSTEVTVSAVGSPWITTQPVGGVLSSGSLTLEVVAEDTNTPKRPLSYQWYKNDQALSGEETNRLVIQSSSASGNHKYYVIVSNDVGQTRSIKVSVSILRSPRITRQPVGGFVNSKQGFNLEVVAINPNPAPNNGALSYQWYRNKSPLNDEEGRRPRLLVRPSRSHFEFESTYYVEVSYRGEVTRSDEVQVAFGVRLRNSKWEGLLDSATDPSLIEIGQIDGGLDLKRTSGENEREVMREPADEEW